MCLFPVHFIASFLLAPPVATQFSVVRAPPVATLASSFHFVTSFLWAPPVATQFSVLSQTFVKVRASCDPFVPFDFIASFLWAPPVATQFSVVWAPPVTTLVISLHRSISVGTACGDSAFCSVIQCFVRTYIHTYVLHMFGHRQWRPVYVI